MFSTRTFYGQRRVEGRKSGSEELWTNPMGMVKIYIVLETSMRHRVKGLDG
jgi:hypothetical protein